jgi:hypothetical protein
MPLTLPILVTVASLILRRDRSWFRFLVPYRIDIGTHRVAKLWAGQSTRVESEPGPHVVTVWSGKVRVGSETVMVGEDVTTYRVTHGTQARWRSVLGLGRQLVTLRREDNQP